MRLVIEIKSTCQLPWQLLVLITHVALHYLITMKHAELLFHWKVGLHLKLASPNFQKGAQYLSLELRLDHGLPKSHPEFHTYLADGAALLSFLLFRGFQLKVAQSIQVRLKVVLQIEDLNGLDRFQIRPWIFLHAILQPVQPLVSPVQKYLAIP